MRQRNKTKSFSKNHINAYKEKCKLEQSETINEARVISDNKKIVKVKVQCST